MSTEVRMSVQVAIAGGPSWKINATDDVEAYSVINVTSNAGTTDKAVELQPATDAARVNLLLMQSDLYGSEIRYKASDGTTDSDPVTLHGPHVFGRGVVSLFGRNVLSLKFTNANLAATNRHARIQILVGRDATP